MNAPWSALLTLAGLALLIQGCAVGSKLQASGTVAGHRLAGTVDSPHARDYLAGRPLPAELAEMRAQYLEHGLVPSRTALAAIARRYSPDVATLLLIETVSAQPDARNLRRRFEAEVASLRGRGLENTDTQFPEDLVVLVVPGWFYVAHAADTGADLADQRRILEEMGVDNHLVPIDENGTVEDNARIVADAIREHSDRPVLLVSASKGGAEVAYALARGLEPADTRAIVGWISIGGVLRGTPFADRVFQPDLCWLARLKLRSEGFDMEGARSLQTTNPSFRDLNVRAHFPIVTYIASPLSGHISDRGSFGYNRMRDHGPNDGLTLLADELIPGSTPLLVPGVDHFFEHEDTALWTAALFRILAAPRT